jgi:hypothetical protein
MSLSSKHPNYSARVDQWTLMRDFYEGADAVKEKGTLYLPATSGMVEDGMEAGGDGLTAYNAYKERAVVHDLVRPAIEAMVGLIHKHSPVIELPEKLEPLRLRATLDGESLEALLRRMNTEQLATGRIGLLLDVPNGALANALPFFVTYDTEAIINWSSTTGFDGKDTAALYVLDESGAVMDANFEWKDVTSYRILTLDSFWNDLTAAEPEADEGEGDGNPGVARDADQSGGNLDTQNAEDNRIAPTTYQTATNDSEVIGVPSFVQPSLAGRTFTEIPFRVVGTKDLVPDPDMPPLLGIARIVKSMYQTEADYRETLHLQGQQTLVVVGGSIAPGPDGADAKRVGAGRYIDVGIGGDAKYVGVTADSLAGFRACIDADKEQASNLGANMLVQKGADAESGDALKIRKAAKTATLGTIAVTACEALEQLLKLAAVAVGANPDEVRVKPNMDYSDEVVTGKDVLEWMSARAMGAPISLQTIHENMKLSGKTRLSYEEELERIEEEGPTVMPSANPNDPRFSGEEDDEAVDPNAKDDEDDDEMTAGAKKMPPAEE